MKTLISVFLLALLCNVHHSQPVNATTQSGKEKTNFIESIDCKLNQRPTRDSRFPDAKPHNFYNSFVHLYNELFYLHNGVVTKAHEQRFSNTSLDYRLKDTIPKLPYPDENIKFNPVTAMTEAIRLLFQYYNAIKATTAIIIDENHIMSTLEMANTNKKLEDFAEALIKEMQSHGIDFNCAKLVNETLHEDLSKYIPIVSQLKPRPFMNILSRKLMTLTHYFLGVFQSMILDEYYRISEQERLNVVLDRGIIDKDYSKWNVDDNPRQENRSHRKKRVGARALISHRWPQYKKYSWL